LKSKHRILDFIASVEFKHPGYFCMIPLKYEGMPIPLNIKVKNSLSGEFINFDI
jgi:hypothetical protein